MGNDGFKLRATIIGSIMVVLVMIGGVVAVDVHPDLSLIERAAQPLAVLDNSDWHDGNNQSTPLVDLSYSEDYSMITGGTQGCLSQNMMISYNDGTDAQVGFEIHCVFNQGGLDVANRTVNWSELNHIELILQSQSLVNGTSINTMYNFQGFDIISGNASSFNVTKMYNPDGSSGYSINNVIGCISYWSQSAKISAVTLSTENYTYQGNTQQESVATFNVTIGSVISDTGLRNSPPNETQTSVPTVLTFQVTHNATATEYKYGASVDWNADKNFPTSPSLTTGENYSLVAQDLLSFSFSAVPGDHMTQIEQFSTDPNNDSAIYFLNGQEMCTELMTTQYTIDGSSQTHNTTRIYQAISYQGSTGNTSSIDVVFDGFKYNESTGFSFDPAVITPNSISSSTGSDLNGSGMLFPLVIVIDSLCHRCGRRGSGA